MSVPIWAFFSSQLPAGMHSLSRISCELLLFLKHNTQFNVYDHNLKPIIVAKFHKQGYISTIFLTNSVAVEFFSIIGRARAQFCNYG